MKFIGDFHIHSQYARATSKDMNLETINRWAQLKGIGVVGTGDFTHPEWFKELEEKLIPAEQGLYRLRPETEKMIQNVVPQSCHNDIRFVLSGEVSSIYKKNGRVRKVHTILVVPSLDAAKRINMRLAAIGNIHSDGRPILGLDVKKLAEIIFEEAPNGMVIPAHAWTPWFSVFGSKSGFDSLEECFDELTPKIFAIETGLSSDPAMNWQLSALDRITLISNSDAHSAAKMGREANVFNCEISYDAIWDALQPGNTGFTETIEFFPEEGKYHVDGHAVCGVRLMPEETKTAKEKCPKCGKKVTVGVLNRVAALADRAPGFTPKGARPYKNIIPLPEILAERYGMGVKTKTVQETHEKMLTLFGNEFRILLETPIDIIKKEIDALVAEGIHRMRTGKVKIAPGYDGEFGTIHLFTDEERETNTPQQSLF